MTIEDDPTREAWLPQYADDGTVLQVYHVGPSQLSGADLDSALAGFAGGTSSIAQWQVQLDLSNDGADKFQELTKQAASYPIGDVRRQIAIVLDGEVVSAPQVNDDVDPNVGISGGSAVITMGTGENQQQEAQDLAVVLRYGSLPVSFERDQVQNVSATLGADSLNAGLVAGAGGLILVALAGLFLLTGWVGERDRPERLRVAAPPGHRIVEPVHRHNAHPGRGDGNHRLDRYHRRLVHRVL